MITQHGGWARRTGRYAIEFVVVFLGVWLSFLAEQFREDRGAAEQEQLALSAIASDLETDSVNVAATIVRATTGFEAAQQIAGGDSSDLSDGALAAALTGVAVCSFTGNQRTSRYEALRTGDLSLVRDRLLRSQVEGLYFSSAARDYLHARDCEDSERFMQLIAPWVEMSIPPLDRAEAIPGWGWNDQPVVRSVIDRATLLEDRAMRAHVAGLASRRQFLRAWLQREIETRNTVLQAIHTYLAQ